MKPLAVFFKAPPLQLLLSTVIRLLLFLLTWWVLSEGLIREPVFAILAVFLSVAVSFALWPVGSCHWHPFELLRFIPWFLWNSLLGGLDVARRAYLPSLPLQPEIIEFKPAVPEKPALLLVWIVSLLPGTACVSINKEGVLRVHVLDTSLPVVKKLRDLEHRLARFYV